MDRLSEYRDLFASAPRGSQEAVRYKKRIQAYIHYIMNTPIRQSVNRTPDEEQDYANYNILRAAETRYDYIERMSHFYVSVHGGDINHVRKQFAEASKPAYENFRKWDGTDFDGRKTGNENTMARIKPRFQAAIVDLCEYSLKPHVKKYPSLQSAYKYLQRSSREIKRPERAILFDRESEKDARKTLIASLDEHILQTNHDPETQTALLRLRCTVEIISFDGGAVKHYYRQTSQLNTRILDEFSQILIQHHQKIQSLMKTSEGKIRRYSELSMEEKTILHKFLRSDSNCFEIIFLNSAILSIEAKGEIGRLNFIQKNAENFIAYILSDSKDIMSLDAVSLLFGYSAHSIGELKINQVRKPPIPLMPLYETLDDIKQRSMNTVAMLNNFYLKRQIEEQEKLYNVFGCSDTGRETGIVAGHIGATLGRLKDDDILEQAKKSNPALAKTIIEELYGLGGEPQRAATSIYINSHPTLQGSAAHAILGASGGYVHYLNTVVGHPCESVLRVQELKKIRKSHPDTFCFLEKMVDIFATSYSEMFNHPHSADLLEKLTLPELLNLLNMSSRENAKVLGNLQKIRAIGWGNAITLGLFFYPMFMSAKGLTELSPQEIFHLRKSYELSTTFKESAVLKIMYFISISDFNRAWNGILGEQPDLSTIKDWAKSWEENEKMLKSGVPTAGLPLHYFLAWIHMSAYDIMKVIIQIPSEDHQDIATMHWDETLSPSALALKLLEAMGIVDPLFKKLSHEIRYDFRPRFQRLTRCIDDKSINSAEIIPLVLRGDRKLMTGPDTIAYLKSPMSEHYINNPLKLLTFENNTDDEKIDDYLSHSHSRRT